MIIYYIKVFTEGGAFLSLGLAHSGITWLPSTSVILKSKRMLAALSLQESLKMAILSFSKCFQLLNKKNKKDFKKESISENMPSFEA